MFFTLELFSTKSPGALLWALGHGTKKMNAKQARRFNLKRAVLTVISPEKPLALRANAVLLKGAAQAENKIVTVFFNECRALKTKLIMEQGRGLARAGGSRLSVNLPTSKGLVKINMQVTNEEVREILERAERADARMLQELEDEIEGGADWQMEMDLQVDEDDKAAGWDANDDEEDEGNDDAASLAARQMPPPMLKDKNDEDDEDDDDDLALRSFRSTGKKKKSAKKRTKRGRDGDDDDDLLDDINLDADEDADGDVDVEEEKEKKKGDKNKKKTDVEEDQVEIDMDMDMDMDLDLDLDAERAQDDEAAKHQAAGDNEDQDQDGGDNKDKDKDESDGKDQSSSPRSSSSSSSSESDGDSSSAAQKMQKKKKKKRPKTFRAIKPDKETEHNEAWLKWRRAEEHKDRCLIDPREAMKKKKVDDYDPHHYFFEQITNLPDLHPPTVKLVLSFCLGPPLILGRKARRRARREARRAEKAKLNKKKRKKRGGDDDEGEQDKKKKRKRKGGSSGSDEEAEDVEMPRSQNQDDADEFQDHDADKTTNNVSVRGSQQQQQGGGDMDMDDVDMEMDMDDVDMDGDGDGHRHDQDRSSSSSALGGGDISGISSPGQLSMERSRSLSQSQSHAMFDTSVLPIEDACRRMLRGKQLEDDNTARVLSLMHAKGVLKKRVAFSAFAKAVRDDLEEEHEDAAGKASNHLTAFLFHGVLALASKGVLKNVTQAADVPFGEIHFEVVAAGEEGDETGEGEE